MCCARYNGMLCRIVVLVVGLLARSHADGTQLLMISSVSREPGAVGARFVRGDPQARITWYVMSEGMGDKLALPTVFLSRFNPSNKGFSKEVDRLTFRYLAAHDRGVTSPLQQPLGFCLTALPRKDVFLLAGVKAPVFVACVVPFTMIPAARIPPQVASVRPDYGLEDPQAIWRTSLIIPLPLASERVSVPADETAGVWDIRAAKGEKNLYLCGTTRNAESWFSSSRDDGVTWETPVVFLKDFVHPSMVELANGNLTVFGIRTKSVWNVEQNREGKTAGEYLFRQRLTTGSLCKVERDREGAWSQISPVVRRSDVLNASVCADDKNRLYLAFDAHPRGTPSLVQDKKGFKHWEDPRPSIICLTHSVNGGTTWSKPVEVTSGIFEDTDPDIEIVDGRLMVTFTRRQGNIRNVYAALLTAKDIGLTGVIGGRTNTRNVEEGIAKDTAREKEQADIQKKAKDREREERRLQVQKAVKRLQQPPPPVNWHEGKERDFSRDLFERTEALRTLQQFGDTSVVPLLIDHLSDKYENPVREYAIDALGQMKDTRAVPALIRLMENPGRVRNQTDRDLLLRVAAGALGKLGDPRALQVLEKTLSEAKDEDVQRRVRQAIDQIRFVQRSRLK